MKRLAFLIFALTAFMLGMGTMQPATPPPLRFVAIEVRIDPMGEALGAYQVEVTLPGGRLVGVEGGSAESFASPPHYDPRALHSGGRERVIIAALADQAPPVSREAVVAVLHYAVAGEVELEPKCVLIAAGDEAANRLNATSRAVVAEPVPLTNEGDGP
jgi:hypothetical protein